MSSELHSVKLKKATMSFPASKADRWMDTRLCYILYAHWVNKGCFHDKVCSDKHPHCMGIIHRLHQGTAWSIPVL